MMKLFNTDQDPELPEGLIDQELSNIESLVLKTLAFYRKHSSKYDIKRMLQDVFSIIPKYSSVKSSTIDKCIKTLIEKRLLNSYSGDYVVPNDICLKIMPLAKENLPLIKSIYNYYSNHYSFS